MKRSMRRHQQHIDPYLAMMKQLERGAVAYAVIAGIALATAFFVAGLGNDKMGLLAPVVGQVQYTIGLGLLCACGVSCAVSLWLFGRYVYFARWPERFD